MNCEHCENDKIELAQAPDLDPLTAAIVGLVVAIVNVVRVYRKEES